MSSMENGGGGSSVSDEARRLVELGFRLGSEQRIVSGKEYESKWVREWFENRLFEPVVDEGRPKFFICVPYAYQNGPLHLGHGFTFTRGDVIARYKRMRGFNVLFPWAWHWTGEAVAGTSERLRKGDETIMRMLVEIDGVPEGLLKYFEHPEFICAYYTAENRQLVRVMGWSVDWSREFYTTDLHPYYSKFIHWQYSVLRRRSLVTMGRHPVVWCPVCQSATGDHDRLKGVGIYPEEFTLVYFTFGDIKLAAATLRPETVYGVTNIWLNPDVLYSVVVKDGVKILVSADAVRKLSEQWQGLQVLESFEGKRLIGGKARAPLTGKEVPILPAWFVDPSFGTGVVYSVPAHAPYDYVALKELKNSPEKLAPYGVNPKTVEELKPVKVIAAEGFGDHPAVEAVEKLGITSQSDERLEDLTREIYSKEFHKGVMVVEEYRGRTVAEARSLIRERLKSLGEGDTYYDLSGKVVCRSGDECLVKIVEDQWFLKFSDPEWKEKVRRHLAVMNVYPEEARAWFYNVVDWLHDWACTRKTGLGTPLPWDPSWKVETLSDSTIYPALYTLSRLLNKNPDAAAKLNTEALDYVFHGVGDADIVAAKSGIDPSLLRSLRREFLYWYGVDMRVSAKDLVPNHLTFYLFHHTGIFGEEHWPRGISVNGMITIEGQVMSKSKGNFIPLKKAVARHGADATRIALMLSAEDLDDPDWREKNAEEAEQFVQNFLTIVRRAVDAEDAEGPADRWLLAALKLSVKTVTEALEAAKTRTACNEVVYGMLNNWRWWVRRNGGRVTRAGRTYSETWTCLLAPFAPFAAEEAWKLLGKNGYVSTSRWPEMPLTEEDLKHLIYEKALEELMDDVREVLKVVKGQPSTVKLYTAAGWKTMFAERILRSKLGDALKWLAETFPEKLGDGRRIGPRLVQELRGWLEKHNSLCSAAGFRPDEDVLVELIRRGRSLCLDAAAIIEREAGLKAVVLDESEAVSDAEREKAVNSLPLKPAIYVVTG
jgi:leucyl-tRNA synthetase